MKVGLLGYGSIGKRHAVNADELGHEVAVHDPGMVSGRRSAIIEWADKVVIASPTSQHGEDITDCQIFKKPMLVEKPIADRLSMGLQTPFVKLVGYNLRYHAIVEAIRHAINTGKIGTPRWANIVLGQRSVKPEYLQNGAILNWSHEIDLALHLLGPAKLVGSNVRRTETAREDIADLQLTHHSGCLSTVHLDYVSNPWIRVGTIVGDKGQIYYDLEGNILDICGEIERFPKDTFDLSYQKELKAFLTDDIGFGCTALEAVNVLKICLEAAR